ncbi:hypothetical protein DL766_006979 [Monosporascus sp. MC13-8B]|uniref:Zn(2)-C6 fungal-type domain-containing protein n=1 Tax=Monosporascus cannonballus TaxID=155416 RepID=A0ABY0H888_9PEZI|nr:hypothetical protein DL763_006721 [Monosporascus cannonballus]RYO87363.1 hypothetical protein DL762_004293 [Monosporascus cannonballus]RYP25654.1 hypothetical protein DL766_006979 [Monosporascus sp. MC13-8B]
MGSYSGLELQRPSGLPDTPPPELVSPSSSSYSSSISEARPWSTAAPISPPMSSYEPGTKAGVPTEPEQSQTQRGAKRSAPRQQLPSLSSLFGPPGPLSPQPRDFEPASYVFRNESVSSGSWSQSSFSESRRPDYALSSQEPPRTFRSMSDRPRLPALGNGLSFETSFGPQIQSQYHSPISGQPQRPPGPISMEVAPVKDGLGPKIWTGTHFLPRFVRQAEVPGEGLCYFYDDGTHCKAVIDGEPVNAHWGVTKAGKPRKRLAIACLTCREKKIKCDPDFPRCVQCEKFGRVCKFKNAPRGGHNTSPTLSPSGQGDSRQITPHDRASEQSRPRSASSEAVSPRTTTLKRPPSTEDLSGRPPKKAKDFYDPYPPAASRPGPLLRAAESAKTGLPWQRHELPRLSEDILCRSWRADPYVFSP